jgi:aspartyl protease family protein
VAPGFIDGRDVTFLVDTGATLVAVDERLAGRLGLVKGVRWPMRTANGATEGWRTLLRSVRIGGIEMRAVPAVIMPATGVEEVLLGMSFLQRVEMIQKDGVLILRAQ